ncbi:MAG: hypothetical protein COU44_00030 [Candidatus Nealsonbacteria bacterium CG10_big_fil_rev_8_21_14_0_10_40_24]|nr:MAG: hypothetical protein COU44_00030 [Candidatus Nealsonbacteria bacterium CG10_big_fil_rev_8_21_14_0_10_40_24]
MANLLFRCCPLLPAHARRFGFFGPGNRFYFRLFFFYFFRRFFNFFFYRFFFFNFFSLLLSHIYS